MAALVLAGGKCTDLGLVAGTLSHLDAAIKNALVRPTQRELFHRTTPVLLGFLRFLVAVNFFRQFPHNLVMFFQPDAHPCLSADAVNSGLFAYEATLFHHVIESAPLGWIFTMFFAPLFVRIPDRMPTHAFPLTP